MFVDSIPVCVQGPCGDPGEPGEKGQRGYMVSGGAGRAACLGRVGGLAVGRAQFGEVKCALGAVLGTLEDPAPLGSNPGALGEGEL